MARSRCCLGASWSTRITLRVPASCSAMQGSATSFGRMPTEPAEDLTEDAVLGGRLVLWQPRRGHRVGHDAILLAAAADGRSGDRAIELGAGVGAAGLALARRIAGL